MRATTAERLTPKNSYEAALVLTLIPGPYTLIVRGSGTSTGIGQVEVYDTDAWGN